VGLVLVVTAVAIEAISVATAMPTVARDLGGISLYGWTFSAFMLANLVGTVAGGAGADRRGPAGPLMVGLALFAAGLAVAGGAPSMAVVVVGRAVQGLGAGAVAAVAYVSIGRGYPPEARPRMLAVLSTAWVVPGLVGPAVAGAVAQHLTWRLVFLGLLPVVAVAGVMSFVPLRRLPPVAREPKRPDGSGSADAASDTARLPAAVALAVGAGMVLAALSSRAPVSGTLTGVVGALVSYSALRQLMPDGTFSARPWVGAAVAIRGLLTFCFFGTEAFLPLALTSIHHESPTQAGLVLTTATLGWTTGSWVQARRANAWGRRRTLVTGLVLVLSGVGAVSVVVAGAPAPVAVASWAVAGLGMGLAYPTTILVALEHAEPGSEGAASASVQLSDVLGVSLGTGLGGAALSWAVSAGGGRVVGIGWADALGFAGGLLALVACLRLPSTNGEARASEGPRSRRRPASAPAPRLPSGEPG
jgi:MFS family permease